MKVGILADTHDNVDAIQYLVNFFEDAGVEIVCHAGDFISPFTVPELAKFPGRVIGVFGNNDGDRETLQSQAEGTDVSLFEPPHRFELGERQCVMAHRPADLPDPIPDDVDLVINGHTHEPNIHCQSSTTRINPGEAGGWLSGTTRAVVYDTSKDSTSMEQVPAP
jgi:putative phosphoesterase